MANKKTSQPTTKEPSELPSSLQKSTPATERDLVTELERLSIHFPRTDMDSRKWAMLFQSFSEDFKNKSLEEIRDGCRRYRQNAENRFFPTPGQLLEACKNPFDTKERKYAPLEDLPPAMGRQDALALIEGIRKKYNVRDPHEIATTALKDAILERPPLKMTPELEAREKALADERKQALQRALQEKLDAKASDFYARND